MKSFYVFYKEDDLSFRVATKLKNDLSENGLFYDETNPNLVISVGGDGTMLKVIHKYINQLDNTYFCGIHTGTLGFYTDYLVMEVDDLIARILNNEYQEIAFNMVSCEVECEDRNTILYGLNEIRVENSVHTQVMDVFVSNNYFETFRGNGLCFSTPTGSTGYNKSLGGAIMHPKTEAMQMSEIASINNIAYRALGSPLILTKNHPVKIVLKRIDGVILGYDNFSIHLEREFPKLKSLTFQLSDKKVKFVRYRRFAFMDRVKQNFINDDRD
ncbi:MAG: NAD kinase [Bacilli bacterium]|jgi:NAD+ kinase|nr:NAD kinase [Bacilli bacterium]